MVVYPWKQEISYGDDSLDFDVTRRVATTGRIMDLPLIFPGLGARLSSVIQSLNVSSEPVFSMKCTGSKIYIDIVWITATSDGQKSGGKGLDTTTLSTKTPVNHPVRIKKKKKKSPSTQKRDRRRLMEWRARKKSASLLPESKVFHKETCATKSRKSDIMDSTCSVDFLETSQPEVLEEEEELTYTPRPPAFVSSESESDQRRRKVRKLDHDYSPDPDADLFVQYTETPIETCWCRSSRENGKLTLCTYCFETALCHREECIDNHRALCLDLIV
jgi:hypothetical protein